MEYRRACAYLPLLMQALFYACGFITLRTAAKELGLTAATAGKLFEGLTRGEPDSFVPWLQAAPDLYEAALTVAAPALAPDAAGSPRA